MSDLTRKKRYNWSETEEKYFKKIFEEKKIPTLLSGQKYRKDSIYGIVSNELKKLGYDRTIIQIKQKWQNMKRDNNTAKSKKRSTTASTSKQIDDTPSPPSYSKPEIDEGIYLMPIKKEKNDDEQGPSGININETSDQNYSEILDFHEDSYFESQPQDEESLTPLNQDVDHPDPSPDRSKGRGSYAKALHGFHEKWVASCNLMWTRQQAFWQEQNEAQRQWEEQLLESQKAHDRELVAMSNAALTSAINSLVNARQQPVVMPFPPMPMSPSSERESPAAFSDHSSPSFHDSS